VMPQRCDSPLTSRRSPQRSARGAGDSRLPSGTLDAGPRDSRLWGKSRRRRKVESVELELGVGVRGKVPSGSRATCGDARGRAQRRGAGDGWEQRMQTAGSPTLGEGDCRRRSPGEGDGARESQGSRAVEALRETHGMGVRCGGGGFLFRFVSGVCVCLDR
jgi:hypothetical protein